MLKERYGSDVRPTLPRQDASERAFIQPSRRGHGTDTAISERLLQRPG